MTSLPTRLEGAAAGSRELDAEVWCLFDGWAGVDHPPSVTTSIDAAVALAERVLPRWGFDMGIPARMGEHGGRPWAAVWPPVEDGEPRRYSRNFGRDNSVNAATPALALCAAILRAHAEQVQG